VSRRPQLIPTISTFAVALFSAPCSGRAIYLGSSLYRIHGSNEPDKIGQAVSSGCIRMTNQDVIDLYNRVQIGATVIVQ